MIDQIARQVARHLNDSAVSHELKTDAQNALSEIRTELMAIQQENAYETFLLGFVKQERDKYVADSVDELPADYNELRPDPVCNCKDPFCHLKEGRLPPAVRNADTVPQGIERFKLEHTGNPIVLQQGRERFDERKAHVQYVLETINIALSNRVPIDEVRAARENPPGADEADADDETEPEPKSAEVSA